MSAATTAPPGPLPVSAARSTPRSAASRRAFGEASVRRARAGAGAGSRGSRARRAGRDAALRGSRRALAGREHALRSSRRRARRRRRRRRFRRASPSAGASISTVTLSVSISSSGSPFATDVALRLQPAQHLARLLRHPERRHDHIGRHQSLCAPSKRADSTTASASVGLFRCDCVSRMAGQPAAHREVPAAGDEQLLGREARDHLAAVGVTTSCSSIRAACQPSEAGQNVSSAKTMPSSIISG